MRARGYAELPQYYPQPGWVEHDPEEIWSTVERGGAPALAEARRDRRRGRRDRHHQPARDHDRLGARDAARPIHRAIVWQCRRTAPHVRRLRADGLRAAACASAPGSCSTPTSRARRSRWLLDHVPGARRRAERGELAFGTVDTLAALEAHRRPRPRHRRRPTPRARSASTSARCDWDDEMLRHARRPARGAARRGGPRPASFGETRGSRLAARAACRSPASPATSRRRCSGRRATSPARPRTPTAPAASCCSTPAPRRSPRARPADHGRLADRRADDVRARGQRVHRRRGRAVAARRARAHPERGREPRRWRESVPDTGGVYFVPAFVGLGAPYWDMYARGHHRRAHARHHRARTWRGRRWRRSPTRAATCWRRWRRTPGLRCPRAPGGRRRRRQRLPLPVPGRRARTLPCCGPRVIETTALGAAYLAGLGAGLWRSLDAVAGARRSSARSRRDGSERRGPAVTRAGGAPSSGPARWAHP